MYNEDGNFDRVMSFMMIMLYREQLYQHKVKHVAEDVKDNALFTDPIFMNNLAFQSSVKFEELF
jgi:hypothetical protein